MKDSASTRMVELTEEEHLQFQLFLKMQQQQRQTQPASPNSLRQFDLEMEFNQADNRLPDFQQVLNTQNELLRETMS